MRKTHVIVLAAVLGVATSAAAQPSRERIRDSARTIVENFTAVHYQQGREEQTDRQTRTLKLGANGELSLSNIAGDITVAKGNGSETTIEIVKTARARTADEAKAQLGLVNVEITERNSRAEVRTEYPRNDQSGGWGWGRRGGINVSVAYNISAPAGTRLTINSVSGSIRVSDVKGDLSVNTVSGGRPAGERGDGLRRRNRCRARVEILDTQIDGARRGPERQRQRHPAQGHGAARQRRQRQRHGSGRRRTVRSRGGAFDQRRRAVRGSADEGRPVRTQLSLRQRPRRGDRNTGFELEANSFSGSVRSDLPLTNSSTGGDNGMMRRRSLPRRVWGRECRIERHHVLRQRRDLEAIAQPDATVGKHDSRTC
jgi:hypothetical protein